MEAEIDSDSFVGNPDENRDLALDHPLKADESYEDDFSEGSGNKEEIVSFEKVE